MKSIKAREYYEVEMKKSNTYGEPANMALDFLVVISGQRCSMACRDCANFSPYLAKKFAFYDYRKILNDINKISNEIYINKIQLQGGEFFLHPNAYELLEGVVKIMNNSEISVATNGTIMPSQKILDILKTKDVSVRISNYEKANQILINKFKSALDEHKIHYWMYSFASGKDAWYKLGGIEVERQTEEVSQKTYASCPFRGCLTLENGFISKCSRATVAHHVQNFEPENCDSVNIRSSGYSSNVLVEYAKNGMAVSACRYCRGGGGGRRFRLQYNFQKRNCKKQL